MESVENKEGMKSSDSKFKQEIHSKVIRAGKRTYFFDVKSTRNEEYYLTITESKKRYTENGKFQYEKHKIFLYKEDFQKFADSLKSIIDYISDNQPELEAQEEKEEEVTIEETPTAKDYTNVDFEDI
jgi:adenylosuccinate synthase